MRRLPALLPLLALLLGTWLRVTPPPPSFQLQLRFQPLPLPSREVQARQLGPFTVEAMWEMHSPHVHFSGFSALVPLEHGRLLAIGDRGYKLLFSPPGEPHTVPRIRRMLDGQAWKESRHDAEAATIDPATGRLWIGWEGGNAITRHGTPFGSPQSARPRAMRGWKQNTGPEAMVRLVDGRFVVLCEGFSGWISEDRHKALLFSGDPISSGEPQAFTFAGPVGFSPTDMAQLPDGRVLVLMRSLVWPVPARFEGGIALADPADIRPDAVWRGVEVARLSYPLPVDNFEGLAITPRPDGKVTVWLISDDNGAVLQRTLLWKLRLDPAGLPPVPGRQASKKAHG